MELLDKYLGLKQQIFSYFEYEEGWRVLSIEDSRSYYWRVDSDSEVHYAESEEELVEETGNYYIDDLYKEHLYRKQDFTMIGCDSMTDGNVLLRIFSNKNERPKSD